MGPSSIGREDLSRRTAFLRQLPLFSETAEEDLNVLAGHFFCRKYRKKEIIFHQGDDSHSLYVVLNGKVRVYSTSPGGNETSIRIFSRHDLFGEFAAIDGRPRSTTAQAGEDCTLLEMNQTNFLQCLSQMPDLAMGMLRFIVEKIRMTTAYAETIAQYDTAGRLLHIFLYYKELFGREIKAEKQYEVNLSMNQSDLASLVGARREWVNRILRNWKKRGLIDYRQGKIMILDLPAVEEERDRRTDRYGGDTDW